MGEGTCASPFQVTLAKVLRASANTRRAFHDEEEKSLSTDARSRCDRNNLSQRAQRELPALMEIVFRKPIRQSNSAAEPRDQVINRYRLDYKREFSQDVIEAIAALLYKNDYGHPFTEDDGVYWTLE